MTSRKSDRDPLRTLADRDPAPIDGVEEEFVQDQRAMILTLAKERGEGRRDRASLGTLPSSEPPSWTIRLAGLSVAVAAVLTLVLTLGGSSDRAGVGVEFAAAAVRVAEANPRILVTAPGWSITHVEPLEPDSGETQFSNGSGELSITWYPARFYQDYREDRANVEGPAVPIELLGETGTMVRYGGADFATMLPPQGNVFVEIRGDLGSEDAYREILGSLQSTSVETWLAAMPPGVVQPDEQDELVDSLLMDVPLPPGFDLGRLRDQAVLNPDGLRYKVADSVSCGWLDSWAAANASGDDAAIADAVDAMATADEWPVMQERPVLGGHSKSILSYARQISNGRLDRSFGGVVTTTEEGVSHEYGPAYALPLSCDSMVKRRVEEPFSRPGARRPSHQG